MISLCSSGFFTCETAINICKNWLVGKYLPELQSVAKFPKKIPIRIYRRCLINWEIFLLNTTLLWRHSEVHRIETTSYLALQRKEQVEFFVHAELAKQRTESLQHFSLAIKRKWKICFAKHHGSELLKTVWLGSLYSKCWSKRPKGMGNLQIWFTCCLVRMF